MLIGALVLLVLLVVILLVSDLRSGLRVPVLEPHPAATALPPLTVIIPARNEALRIGRCLDGLAQQQLPALDIVVLDDASSDGTAEVVRSFAPRLPGLRLVPGEPLPPGWAGKCWACWQAAQSTDAAWLLFLDADTAPQSGMIVTLMDYARRHRLDLLTLLPLLELGSFWERVLMPPFAGLIQAVLPLDKVNNPRSRLAMANGQCILIRRDVYCAVGGHRAIRDSVLEDVRLAEITKWAGYHIRVVGGPNLMRVRMYTNFAEIAEGLRKNAFAGARAGGAWRTAWGGFRQSVLAFAPATLLLLGLGFALAAHPAAAPLLLSGAVLFVITIGFWGYVIRRLHRLHPTWALLYPLGTMGYFALAGLSFWNVLRGRGVIWKGRSYRG